MQNQNLKYVIEINKNNKDETNENKWKEMLNLNISKVEGSST